jgi:hypothetical protein
VPDDRPVWLPKIFCGGNIMKTCSLNDFMAELTLWLDKDYINRAYMDIERRFVLEFNDGTKNVYIIDDCNEEQIKKVLNDLKKKGVATDE